MVYNIKHVLFFGATARNIFCSKKLFPLGVSNRWESSNVNDVIRAISNLLIFFTKRFCKYKTHKKHKKHKKHKNHK